MGRWKLMRPPPKVESSVRGRRGRRGRPGQASPWAMEGCSATGRWREGCLHSSLVPESGRQEDSRRSCWGWPWGWG